MIISPGAQLTKIVCYNPQYPYLILIPTAMLSAGMVMYFTLASAMVADVCDEDELHTGLRSEGAYYSIFWWFMKMGMAVAGVVAGIILIFCQFDEQQSSMIDSITSPIKKVVSTAEKSVAENETNYKIDTNFVTNNLRKSISCTDNLLAHFSEKKIKGENEHYNKLIAGVNKIKIDLNSMVRQAEKPGLNNNKILMQGREIIQQSLGISHQSNSTMLLLRIFEISIPVLLCLISIIAIKLYPLSEKRMYEIKMELEQRKKTI